MVIKKGSAACGGTDLILNKHGSSKCGKNWQLRQEWQVHWSLACLASLTIVVRMASMPVHQSGLIRQVYWFALYLPQLPLHWSEARMGIMASVPFHLSGKNGRCSR